MHCRACSSRIRGVSVRNEQFECSMSAIIGHLAGDTFLSNITVMFALHKVCLGLDWICILDSLAVEEREQTLSKMSLCKMRLIVVPVIIIWSIVYVELFGPSSWPFEWATRSSSHVTWPRPSKHGIPTFYRLYIVDGDATTRTTSSAGNPLSLQCRSQSSRVDTTAASSASPRQTGWCNLQQPQYKLLEITSAFQGSTTPVPTAHYLGDAVLVGGQDTGRAWWRTSRSSTHDKGVGRILRHYLGSLLRQHVSYRFVEILSGCLHLRLWLHHVVLTCCSCSAVQLMCNVGLDALGSAPSWQVALRNLRALRILHRASECMTRAASLQACRRHRRYELPCELARRLRCHRV